MEPPVIIHKAYICPFTVQSNFARMHAKEIAMLASSGYLTTEERKARYGRTWRVTALGLDFLKTENFL